MLNKNYFSFLVLLLITYRKKHLSIFFISTFIVMLLASVFFIISSIKNDINLTLDNQAEFIVQKYEGGKVKNTPEKWINEFTLINGVSKVNGRVYGRYFYEPNEEYFMIVGVDFFDEQILKSLKNVVDSVDVTKFLDRKNMIIGQGVKKHFDEYHFFDYYTFRPPDRSIEKVYIYDAFDKKSSIVSNDIIIMDIDEARKILGVEDGYVSDIAIEVPNPLEVEMVREKLIISHFNMRIIEKGDIKKYYINLFNYKGGVFLTLYIVVLVTFLLILYQRFSMISHIDFKEIAILRVSGWRINEVIWLKVIENAIVAIVAYMTGIIAAYIYVYILNAPILRGMFLGFKNLSQKISFTPNVELGMLGLIFLIFVIPFIIAVIIPVWRISIIEPAEVIR